MHKAIYILFIGFVLSLTSCRKDFDTVPSQGNLEFSKKTVYLDTVFTDIGSSTYMLKVYNRSNNDISIPYIRLAKPDSKYRLMVDGMTGVDADNSGQGDGRFFPNVELLAKDSLFIFIETTANIADASPTDFLYTDEIEFKSFNTVQKVNLVTLIQDANFIFPNKDLATGIKEKLVINGEQTATEGHALTDAELNWNNIKPYVVYGFALVPNGKTLNIAPGTKVHFHADSGLIVDTGATLKINGDVSTYDGEGNVVVNNEVTFEGDRLEPLFEDIPGQWQSVYIFSDSNDNLINHLTLKNASVGIYLPRISLTPQPKVKITNSQIYNSAFVGILGQNANITGENVVVNYAGQACMAAISGGTYSFSHCTFNNNWGSPQQDAVNLSNYDRDANNNIINVFGLDQAKFYNCIIYGANNTELYLTSDASAAFNTDFQHCLVKFREAGTGIEGDPLYAFLRSPEMPANGNFINEDPKFKRANSNKLNITDESPANGKGLNLGFTVDVMGSIRTSIPPDIGAYESVPAN